MTVDQNKEKKIIKVCNYDRNTRTSYNLKGKKVNEILIKGNGSVVSFCINKGNGFKINDSKPAREIFVTESGEIIGYNKKYNEFSTFLLYYDPNKTFSDIDITKDYRYIYVANISSKKIEVYDGKKYPLTKPINEFTDLSLFDNNFGPVALSIYNNRIILYIFKSIKFRYIMPATGYIDIFDLHGHLKSRLVNGSYLNSP